MTHECQSTDSNSYTGSKEPELQNSGRLIVLSGPSGVGKGTVVETLLPLIPNLARSVSATTRAKREGELEARDYFFLPKEQFETERNQNKLLEWAEFAGSFYGTPKTWVEEQLRHGRDVLLVIEVVGAMKIRQVMPDAILIFLAPPSFEDLESRLRGRGTESDEKITLRLNKARQELRQRHLFHYEVINNIVNEAVDNLAHIIYAERLRIPNSLRDEI